MPPKGSKHPDEARAKMSKAHRGQKLSEETREKLSKARRGKHCGESNSQYGKHHSEETREKMSKALMGHKVSKETRIKISKARRGLKLSEKTREKMSNARRGIYCAENCPSWKGGISFEPYCSKFNEDLKNRVRAFFNNICVLCGKTKEENKQNLCVHHVNYDKMICCNDVKPMFVSLCRGCHTRTNNDREYWEEFLTNEINKKYGGKSFYTIEEYGDICIEKMEQTMVRTFPVVYT